MKRTRIIIFFFCIVILQTLAVSSVCAQQMTWGVIGQNFAGGFTPVAIATEDGIVLGGGINGLIITTNGGASWQMITPPALANGSVIANIAIYDRNTFCVQSVVGNNVSRIYITNDQGATWRPLFPPGPTFYFPLIFLNDPLKVLCMMGASFVLTRDGGASYSTYATTLNPYQIRYAADGSLRLYSRTNANVQAASSNDSGKTWTASTTIIFRDCYSFLTDQTDPNVMCIINEDFFVNQHNISMVFHTTDNGTSWDTTLKVGLPYLSGSSDVGCYDYFVNTVANGVLRSNDKGKTWNPIGGPSTIADRDNIAAVDDSLIYVVDATGKVWATAPQSHTGRLSIRNNLFFGNKSFSSCDTAAVGYIIISGNGCSTPSPKSVKIIGADSSSYTLLDTIKLPVSFPDTIRVRFTPNHPGKMNASLQLTGTNNSVQLFDLATTVNTLSIAVSPTWLMDRDTISYCSLLTSTLKLRTPCPQAIGSVTISGIDSAAFSLVSPVNPILPRDSNIVVNVIPLHPGLLNAVLTIRTSTNITQNWLLRPFVKTEKLALTYNTKISTQPDSIYECQKVRDTILIKAPCVLPTINISLSDSTAFKLSTRSITLPKDSMIIIEYDGAKNSLNKGTTVLLSSSWSDTARIPIKHHTKKSPVLLERIPRIANDSFSICNPIIDSFVFRSPCPHRITSIRFEGPDASQFSISSPLTLNLPTDSLVAVKLIPKRSGLFDATLVFESEDGTSWRFAINPRIVPSLFSFSATPLFIGDSIGACSGGFDTLKIRTVCPAQVSLMYITGPNASSFILRTNAPLTLPRDSVVVVQCLSGSSGLKVASLHIELSDGRFWNIPISANIITAPLAIAPNTLFNNDTVASCSFMLDSVLLKARCPLNVRSVTITGPDANSFSIFGKTPYQLPTDSVLVVKCAPNRNGSLTATLRIETLDGRVFFIPLTARGVVSPFGHRPSALFINDTIASCVTSRDTLDIVAICPLLITSITITGADASSFALSGATSIQLPGDSLVIVNCTPLHLGQLDATLHILAADGRTFDVPMKPYVEPSLLSIAPTTLFINDTMLWCSSLRDTLALTAICPLDLTGITITGYDASSFTLKTSSQPRLPSDSLVIIECTPTHEGSLTAALHIISDDGRTWDVPINIVATQSPLTISRLSLFVADSFSVCSTISDSLLLGSICPFDITSLTVTGVDASSFVITGLASRALPQDSVLSVVCKPLHSGDLSATVHIIGRDGKSWDVPMNAYAYAVSTFSIAPLLDAMTDTIGGDIAIKIASRHTGGAFDAEFTLHYDTASLIYRGVYDERGIEHTIQKNIGANRIRFAVAIDTILTANFSYYPVSTDCVPITIDSITGANATLQCLDILTKNQQANICASPSCGRGLLANLVRFNILKLSVMPNPTSGNIMIVADHNVSNATIEIVDALGVIRKTFTQMKLNHTGTPLDIESLPSGIYETRVTTELGQGTVRWVLRK